LNIFYIQDINTTYIVALGALGGGGYLKDMTKGPEISNEQ
jgi:hypothetical protein